jgi:DNA modification methylase
MMLTSADSSQATNSNRVQLYCGDALSVLKDSLVTESVDMVFCSSPYWQLRGSTEIVASEIGPEKSYKEYLNKVMAFFNEVRIALTRAGALFMVVNATCNTTN